MSIFICEKCGCLDNTACNNNYWHAKTNKYKERINENIHISYKEPFSFFENHVCCSDCCDGVEYKDNSGTILKDDSDIQDKEHWSKFGKETLIQWEKRSDGSMVNAIEFFNLKNKDELL